MLDVKGKSVEEMKKARDLEIREMESDLWRHERQIDIIKAKHGAILKVHQEKMKEIQAEEQEEANAKANAKTE